MYSSHSKTVQGREGKEGETERRGNEMKREERREKWNEVRRREGETGASVDQGESFSSVV